MNESKLRCHHLRPIRERLRFFIGKIHPELVLHIVRCYCMGQEVTRTICFLSAPN